MNQTVRKWQGQWTWVLLGGALALLCGHAAAQISTTDAPPQSSDHAPRYTLSGSVVNSITGEPLRRAVVQVYGNVSATGFSDAEGHFKFSGVAGGTAYVSARKPGFFGEQELSQRVRGVLSQTSVQVGPDSSAVVVRLVPESTITGRVTGDGEPAETIPVTVFEARIVNGLKTWEQRGAASTDEDGSFRIAELMPGTYYVEFGPYWRWMVVAEGAKAREWGYARTFYPGAADPESARGLALAAGQVAETDLALKREPFYQVSGTISSALAVQGVSLQFLHPSGETDSFPLSYNVETGKFQTRVMAGTYTLRARGFAEGATSMADFPLTVSGDVSGIHLLLGPPASIPVSLTMKSVSGRDNAATRGGPTLPLTVHLMAQSVSLTGGVAGSILESEGKPPRYFFRRIEPGRYSLEGFPSPPWYVASAQSGGIDLLRDYLVVAPGAQPEPIEMVMRDDSATLSGSISGDTAAAGGMVLLIPERAPRRVQVRPAETSFEFAGLPPGGYSVLAVEHADDIEYLNPEAMAPYLSQAKSVTLQPSQTTSIALELTRVGP